MSLRTVLILTIMVGATIGASDPGELWSLVVPILRNLAAQLPVHNDCAVDSLALLNALDNSTFWAVRMADASGNIPSGIMSGNTHSMGDLDGCMEEESAHYCTTTLTFLGHRNISRSVYAARESAIPGQEVSQYLQPGRERWRFPRNKLHVSLCLPSSCSASSISRAAEHVLTPRLYRLGGELIVNGTSCYRPKVEPLDSSEIIFWIFTALFMLLILMSTLLDMTQLASKFHNKKSSTARDLCLSFSARRNLIGLCYRENGGSGTTIIDMLRVLCISTILLSHRYGNSAGGPIRNAPFYEKVYTEFWMSPMLNPAICVDTFFFLSGLTLATRLLKSMKRKPVNVWLLYLVRYLRLTPSYLAVIFVYATVLYRLGYGPYWDARAEAERQFCRDNWWTNILYVSNYVNTDAVCLEHSWYLPCDMHFYLLCAPIVVLIGRKRNLGLSILCGIGVLSFLLPFITVYAKDTDPMLMLYPKFLSNPRKSSYFGSTYVQSHLRALPYIFGVFVGWYTSTLNKKNIKKALCLCLFTIGAMLAIGTSVSGISFYDSDSWLSQCRFCRATYSALHRVTWSMSLSLLFIASSCFLRQSRSPERTISVNRRVPTFPLGPLTYGAYLVHMGVVMFSVTNIRDPVYMEVRLLGILSWGDTVATFLFALVLYLTVEAPARNITKIIVQKIQGQPKEISQQSDGSQNIEMNADTLDQNRIAI